MEVLNLAPAAFKPNVQLLTSYQPVTKILLQHIASIPTLSMEVFSSANSIIFRDCHIDDIGK